MKNSNTTVLGVTVILLVIVGTYYNSQQISDLKPVVLNHDLPSPTGRKQLSSRAGDVGLSIQQSAPCLTARKDTVPPAMFGKLPRPYVNLGFPKMGTSSLHAFFECGGLKSHHFVCGKDLETSRRISCARCIGKSIEASKPPLELCEEADIYTQMDNGTYFPQVELLNEFHAGYPQATFFLTFRNMTKWYHSLSHWPPRPRGPHMDERLRKLNITGFPAGKGKNEQDFSEWYCNHVLRVRQLVANSNHHLIEVDIEDGTIAERMGQMFGIDKGCWGHANVNLNIHPDLNTSDVTLSRKQAIKVKKVEQQTTVAQKAPVEDVEKAVKDGASSDDEELDDWATSDDKTGLVEGMAFSEDNGHEYHESCFHARNNTVPMSLIGKLPKPWINLGFPKIGTTSLNYFFGECGGYTSYHYYCGRGENGKPIPCASCIRESVKKGLAPLAKCHKGDAWTQLDNGRYFPQVELLDEIIKGYPQATFILMFRSMDRWYNSMYNWPPDRNKYQRLTDRLLKLNITGLSKGKDHISAFADWHCNHVQRVRDLISKYPGHSLVEIDVEAPSAGAYLEKLFGIKGKCFAKKNSNVQPEMIPAQ